MLKHFGFKTACFNGIMLFSGKHSKLPQSIKNQKMVSRDWCACNRLIAHNLNGTHCKTMLKLVSLAIRRSLTELPSPIRMILLYIWYFYTRYYTVDQFMECHTKKKVLKHLKIFNYIWRFAAFSSPHSFDSHHATPLIFFVKSVLWNHIENRVENFIENVSVEFCIFFFFLCIETHSNCNHFPRLSIFNHNNYSKCPPMQFAECVFQSDLI